MNTFFNNPWIINIGTGLIVSLISYFFSKFFVEKYNDRKKHNNIDTANKRIISIIEPYVMNENDIDDTIINEVIFSVSREYCCNIKEVYNCIEVRQELVRKILETPYISPFKKRKYIYRLNKIRNNSHSNYYLNLLLDNESFEHKNIEEKRLSRNFMQIYFCMFILMYSLAITYIADGDITELSKKSLITIGLMYATLMFAFIYIKNVLIFKRQMREKSEKIKYLKRDL